MTLGKDQTLRDESSTAAIRADAPVTGRCLCGAVSFAADTAPEAYGACHCPMCRRWTGSALLGVTMPRDGVRWQGRDSIATLQSSAWAERAWCAKCGSGLYYRVTASGPHADEIEIPLGLFDNPNGFHMAREIYIDQKPDSFAFAGEGRTELTRQDCIDRYAVSDGA